MDACRPVDASHVSPLGASSVVLLVVDVINPLEFPEAEAMAPFLPRMVRRLSALKRWLGEQGVVTVYANDHHGAWLSDFREVKARCEALGGLPALLARELAPEPGDHVVLKPRHSAFYGTPLDLLLTELKCKWLIVCGLSTDMCVQMTAADAHVRGFRLWVPADCCAAQQKAHHTTALHYMARVFGACTADSRAGEACGLPLVVPSLATRRPS